MKAALCFAAFSAIMTGCVAYQPATESSGYEVADEVRAKGLADHYYIVADNDPRETGPLNTHQRYQSFRQGCALDFYTISRAHPEHKRWQLRENSLHSGHLGTYRRFVSDSTFQQGKHDLPEALMGDLAWFAQELVRSPLMPYVLIIGHTNSDGSARYNQALSEKRSAVVHAFLVSQGVPATRIHNFGVGETSPIKGADEESARFLNRRIELVTFIPSGSERSSSACSPGMGLALSDAEPEAQP